MAVPECESVGEGRLKKEREKLHEMTDHQQCFKPIPQLIEELNRHLEGWKNYFRLWISARGLREINTYVRGRLTQHLRRRSQRPFRPPERSQLLRADPAIGAGASVAGAINCLRKPAAKVFRRAGCREIRLSGSTRGEWGAVTDRHSLSYSTGSDCGPDATHRKKLREAPDWRAIYCGRRNRPP